MQIMKQIVPIVNLHRQLGLAAFIVIIIISITGILLNHTEGLALKERSINASWLMQWYGIQVEGEPVHYRLETNDSTIYIASLEEHLYLDNQLIADNAGTVIGAVAATDLIIVATPRDIYLLTEQAELIEKMSLSVDINQPVTQIGIDASGLVILRTAHKLFTSTDDYLSWHELSSQHGPVSWSKPTSADAKHLAKLESVHLDGAIDWERIVLDLHSGRIFGSWGVWLFDFAAIIIILLSITGCWTWYKKQQMKKLN